MFPWIVKTIFFVVTCLLVLGSKEMQEILEVLWVKRMTKSKSPHSQLSQFFCTKPIHDYCGLLTFAFVEFILVLKPLLIIHEKWYISFSKVIWGIAWNVILMVHKLWHSFGTRNSVCKDQNVIKVKCGSTWTRQPNQTLPILLKFGYNLCFSNH